MLELAEQDEEVKICIENERMEAMKKEFDGDPKIMFFNKKKFIPMYLAEWFLRKYTAIVLQDELYIYQTGRYVNGERIFKELCTQVLKSEYQTFRLTETINYIKNTVEELSEEEALNNGVILNLKNGLLNL
jgi:hypothetical protein